MELRELKSHSEQWLKDKKKTKINVIPLQRNNDNDNYDDNIVNFNICVFIKKFLNMNIITT